MTNGRNAPLAHAYSLCAQPVRSCSLCVQIVPQRGAGRLLVQGLLTLFLKDALRAQGHLERSFPKTPATAKALFLGKAGNPGNDFFAMPF